MLSVRSLATVTERRSFPNRLAGTEGKQVTLIRTPHSSNQQSIPGQ
jgi:hypothetical protein